MAISKNDIKKKNERKSIVADMARFDEQNKIGTDEETATISPEIVGPEKETEDNVKLEQAAKADQEQPIEETKEEKIKKIDKKAPEGVIAYKQVPDENKTVRKNIVLYPSLCKEIERIVNLEKKKGNKRFTFNDLVNQVLLEYANEYNKK